MIINFKYRRPFHHPARQVLLFVLSCGYLVGCSALELEPITYQEALTRYQETGGIENYRCALVPADDHYRAIRDALPIAVEIDEMLFVKTAGTVQQLQQTDMSETHTGYAADGMTATLTIVRQFNYSEYNESGDRHVDLAFVLQGKTAIHKTFGAACGL
ncbi:hypothetical protein EA797_19895 [Stutzerimonas zhaodongensis]|uniref:Uncharacterized protein n=1 Tax=Stutzerimonas zhaodongensis TaxID=1176257 RepID=A0A3M2HDI5_9GAMM|nr:hypothetical protein [Stutzerimonas zhaodongensis]MCQ4317980.1 hypothetical protein [Stutzerimonas zhaodongensis]RMH87761.1 hypothetical protein EA797_19895 [Stutzerimonas zhaodongensis]